MRPIQTQQLAICSASFDLGQLQLAFGSGQRLGRPRSIRECSYPPIKSEGASRAFLIAR